jgi:hypothetical protein
VPHTRFAAIRRAAGSRGAARRAFPCLDVRVPAVGFKQGWACLFGGLMLAMLFLTHLFWPAHA